MRKWILAEICLKLLGTALVMSEDMAKDSRMLRVSMLTLCSQKQIHPKQSHAKGQESEIRSQALMKLKQICLEREAKTGTEKIPGKQALEKKAPVLTKIGQALGPGNSDGSASATQKRYV